MTACAPRSTGAWADAAKRRATERSIAVGRNANNPCRAMLHATPLLLLRSEHASCDRGVAGEMALHERVKTALDETRTLILGAQILLGFQYQGVFREQFDTLPPYARIMEACALGLMILTIGLLVAPSAFHRIVEHGESTGRGQTLTGRFAAAALLPFAVALGLDLTISLERALDSAWLGRVAGVSFSILALAA